MLIRSLRKAHRWLGFLLLLPLLIEGISGTVLTLEPLWAHTSMTQSAEDTPIRANAILAAARSLVAPDMLPSRYTPQDGPNHPASLQFVPAGGPRGAGTVIKIDAASLLQVDAGETASGFVPWMHRLHAALLIPELGGRSILGWVALGMVVLIVVGIPLWWPGKGQVKAAFTVPIHAKGVRFHRRLHGAVGIWFLPVLMISSLTGITMGFPQASRMALGLPAGFPVNAPARSTPGSLPTSANAGLLDIDGAIVLARAAIPGGVERMAILPATARDPIRMFVTMPGSKGAVATSVVSISGNRIVGLQDARTYKEGDLALRWIRDLHDGEGIGLAGRIVVAVGGLMLPVFGVTGAAMWFLKYSRRRALKKALLQKDMAAA